MSMDAKSKPGADNVFLMPDVYAEGPAADEPTAEVVQLSTDDGDFSEGFDPYDTARLYKK